MGWREWTGIGERSWEKPPNREVQPGKTLWDWLQLLIVPAILVGVTFVWTASQTRSDNKREDRRIAADRGAAEEARQDATLQGYLDEMSGLMLDKKLLTSKRNDAVRAVARTVTLTALRRLDGERKGAVVRFLDEAQLLNEERLLVKLEGADLRGANLEGADLKQADLTKAILTGANLEGADLEQADLTEANLTGANLTAAFLNEARLAFADLPGANLTNSDLNSANLLYADLHGANLHGAILGAARLGGANLVGANLEGAELVGAILVDVGPDDFGPDDFVFTRGLDLGRYIADLPPEQQKEFLDFHEAFLDSLSREALSEFKLTPEQLAKLRKEASGA
jgi:uncharacterized protein YjbI with pentapeptide repeats